MEIKELVKMIDAGFSKEEILEIINDKPAAPETPKTPAPETPKAPKEPAEDPAPAWLGELNKTLGAMTETLKNIQAANIRNAAGGKDPKDATTIAAEILAEVIAPPVIDKK